MHFPPKQTLALRALVCACAVIKFTFPKAKDIIIIAVIFEEKILIR